MENTLRGQTRRTDEGSALIVTLMVLAVVMALSATVAAVTIDNLGSSVKAQQAGSALNAADAGVAHAMTNLRTSGLGGLNKCPAGATAGICTDDPWGNKNAPRTATIPGIAGQTYQVWIEPIAKYPGSNPGVYRIHSTGMANGSAARAVDVDIQVTKASVPLGVVASKVAGGGDFSLTRESLFSTGCVYNRSKIKTIPGDIDAVYGIPTGVHSSQIISDAQGSSEFCPGVSKPIHTGAEPCGPIVKGIVLYPGDQDKLGGSLIGTPCESTQKNHKAYYDPLDVDGDKLNDVDGSFVKSQAVLQALYGFKKPPLSQVELESLRATAVAQGNLFTKASDLRSPTQRQAVMYFDLTKTDPGGTVVLNDIVGFGRPLSSNLSADDPSCTDKSLIIVIDGGNARMNAGLSLVASVFLTAADPNGQLTANGGASLIGTVYAETLNLSGTSNFAMDECFVSNLSTGLMSLTQTSYRELDR
jgi:type II secretory pathway pseudopilin PulG